MDHDGHFPPTCPQQVECREASGVVAEGDERLMPAVARKLVEDFPAPQDRGVLEPFAATPGGNVVEVADDLVAAHQEYRLRNHLGVASGAPDQQGCRRRRGSQFQTIAP